MKHEFSAGVVLYYPGSHGAEFLLLYSKVTNYWGFPKGKIEKGETKQQAAIRETKEETGLDVTLIAPFEYSVSYFFRDKKATLIKKTVYFFAGNVDNKKVQLSREHDEFVWLPYEDARTKISYDNDSEAFERAVAFLQQ